MYKIKHLKTLAFVYSYICLNFLIQTSIKLINNNDVVTQNSLEFSYKRNKLNVKLHGIKLKLKLKKDVRMWG